MTFLDRVLSSGQQVIEVHHCGADGCHREWLVSPLARRTYLRRGRERGWLLEVEENQVRCPEHAP